MKQVAKNKRKTMRTIPAGDFRHAGRSLVAMETQKFFSIQCSVHFCLTHPRVCDAVRCREIGPTFIYFFNPVFYFSSFKSSISL